MSTAKVVGDAESEKSPGEFTIKLTVSVRVSVPSLALTVSGYVEGKLAGLKPVVLIVRVDEPRPVIEVVLKLAVAPLGTPFTLRLTVPPNPPEGTTCTM